MTKIQQLSRNSIQIAVTPFLRLDGCRAVIVLYCDLACIWFMYLHMTMYGQKHPVGWPPRATVPNIVSSEYILLQMYIDFSFLTCCTYESMYVCTAQMFVYILFVATARTALKHILMFTSSTCTRSCIAQIITHAIADTLCASRQLPTNWRRFVRTENDTYAGRPSRGNRVVCNEYILHTWWKYKHIDTNRCTH